MKRLTWNEKIDLLFLYPQISIKQIQQLLDIGQPTALELRENVLKLAEREGRWVGGKKIPTDLLLKAVGLNMNYFEEMAEKEKRFSCISDSYET